MNLFLELRYLAPLGRALGTYVTFNLLRNTLSSHIFPRCPTECRLSHSNSPWQCVVTLRFITNERGQALGEARNELFGPTITDKAEVEGRIRRAQRAILNPTKPRSDFLDGVDEDVATAELSFSNNCVTLQISGPDIADLSFCDLPGSSWGPIMPVPY